MDVYLEVSKEQKGREDHHGHLEQLSRISSTVDTNSPSKLRFSSRSSIGIDCIVVVRGRSKQSPGGYREDYATYASCAARDLIIDVSPIHGNTYYEREGKGHSQFEQCVWVSQANRQA